MISEVQVFGDLTYGCSETRLCLITVDLIAFYSPCSFLLPIVNYDMSGVRWINLALSRLKCKQTGLHLLLCTSSSGFCSCYKSCHTDPNRVSHWCKPRCMFFLRSYKRQQSGGARPPASHICTNCHVCVLCFQTEADSEKGEDGKLRSYFAHRGIRAKHS